MVLCMKLISFAWSVYDGQREAAKLDATQNSSKITEVPGLIPFLGYWCVPLLLKFPFPSLYPNKYFCSASSFFFPSILAGPSFTYASYISFTSHALFAKETDVKSPKSRSSIPPGRRRKAIKRLLTGVVYLGIYSFYGAKIGYGQMLEAGFEGNALSYR